MRFLSAFAAILVAFAISGPVSANQAEGLLLKKSPHSVAVTADRFEAAAKKKGMNVFPRVDHGAAAEAFGQSMPPALVLSVGNPKYGTKFMLKNPHAAIDFPPKALAYEDDSGQVWLAYNSADYLYDTIFARHGLAFNPGDRPFYTKVLEELTDFAVGTAPMP